jgi:hypothetical protein
MIASTKLWRYNPAMLAVTPVKFRKFITIAIKAGS